MNIHCIVCGKTFKDNINVFCGGSYNGKPICTISSIEKDILKSMSHVKIEHDSDCAIYNEPAYIKEVCDCGATINANNGDNHAI